MNYKAVLFDLGGTLVKTAEIPEIYRRILEIYGVKVTANQILEAHKANENNVDALEGQLKMGKQFWDKWNQTVVESIGIQQNSRFLGERISELWWDYADLTLYPDVEETLIILKSKGIKIGIVTNGFRYDYEQILEKLGLSDQFEVVVGADTCNCGKPDTEIFLYAVDKLGLEPGEVVFVGNEYRYDYLGATRAGLKPLMIDREDKISENVDVIKSLTDILNYF
ncbi:MAG: HAD family hydrolase [Candidatus Bathyarchaeota archaeon]|nr:HAD family hydrolase [Candidatus Bathyarchaeota archaeon]